ncbi:MAG: hypothetical protein KBC84_05935 [Proteobacteria bacterium]|nr:hypothetical protein [Pseudomonadota bacterium]
MNGESSRLFFNVLSKISHKVRNELSVPVGLIEDAILGEEIAKEDFIDSEKSLMHILGFFKQLNKFTQAQEEEVCSVDIVEMLQIVFLKESKNEVFTFCNLLEQRFIVEANAERLLFVLRNIRDFLISKLNYYNYSSKVEILVDKNKILLDLTNFTYLYELFFESRKDSLEFSSLLVNDQTAEALWVDLSSMLLAKYQLKMLSEMIEQKMYLTLSF